MGERTDEFMGNVKRGLGELTDDEALEAEGAGQARKARFSRKVKGSLREAGGRLKEGAGDLLDSPSLRARGEAEQIRGRARQAD
jgi:uncharacterized protein YjbJ (UPF0337 family)